MREVEPLWSMRLVDQVITRALYTPFAQWFNDTPEEADLP